MPRLALGDRVRVRGPSDQFGRVVELCGPLGPNGAQIYGVRIRRKPKPTYIEVREDQLELISSPASNGASRS